MSRNGIFQGVPAPKIRRSKFDLSNTFRFTGKFGNLIPFLCENVLPGEHVRMVPTLMARIAPMLAPIMDQIQAKMHVFYVPNRILCSEWEDFISPPGDGEDVAAIPTIQINTFLNNSDISEEYWNSWFGKSTLWNYMQNPVLPYNGVDVNYDTRHMNMLDFLAYQKTFDDYYRDETLVPDETFDWPIPGGVMSDADARIALTMRKKAWSKDIFTSALPFPQRGDDVLIPIDAVPTYKTISEIYTDTGATLSGSGHTLSANNELMEATDSPDPQFVRVENIESISNSSVTINDFRTAVVVQQWLEASARGGARYKEQIPAHFGISISDYRLDRAEYLGGSVQTIQISEVLATAYSSDGEQNLPIGEMAGHGITIGGATRINYRCPEHGVILGIVSFMPVASYIQGLARKRLMVDKFHWPWPEFVGIGEEAIKVSEIFWDPQLTANENEEIFGYQQRYYDWKASLDFAAGDFTDNLSYWLSGTRIFETAPALNEAFIYEQPSDRIFTVQDGTDYLWCQIHTRKSFMRPFPYYSVPGITKI